ncbi:MAG: hypothetical protein IPM52_08600 [Bacteroidetes bacterium]|nr:hypothetical protein [Bacteroidota bacterium]
MKEAAIKLIQTQREKLFAPGFDLEPWKKQTATLLRRIFGEKDDKAAQVEKLEFEFSSWSLRDASGSGSYSERVKRTAAALLDAAMLEIEAFGLAEEQLPPEAIKALAAIIADELTGSQVRNIRQILQGAGTTDDKRRRLDEVFEQLDKVQLKNIITSLLLYPTMSKTFGG